MLLAVSHLGCSGDFLLGFMMNSPLLHSMVNSPLLHSIEVSPLSMGDILDAWGVTGPLGLLAAGLSVARVGSLSVHVSVLLVGPPSFFSETKLKASFSTVSHFLFLALTQSSRVLKWTLLVLYLTSGVLKGINSVMTFSTMSWEEDIFHPRLTHGIERSLFASVFDQISVSVDHYAI